MKKLSQTAFITFFLIAAIIPPLAGAVIIFQSNYHETIRGQRHIEQEIYEHVSVFMQSVRDKLLGIEYIAADRRLVAITPEDEPELLPAVYNIKDGELVLEHGLPNVFYRLGKDEMRLLDRALVEPSTLHIGAARFNEATRQTYIPVALGATNEAEGHLRIGFANIQPLTTLISELALANKMDIAIVGPKKSLILSSRYNTELNSTGFFPANMQLTNFEKVQGTLSSPLSYQDIRFSNYHKLSSFPLLVMIGYQSEGTVFGLVHWIVLVGYLTLVALFAWFGRPIYSSDQAGPRLVVLPQTAVDSGRESNKERLTKQELESV